jgi:hypothetical protein
MSFSWQGVSGAWYEFNVARAKRAWAPSGGLYMFVKPGDMPTMEAGGPICLYLGITDNFAETLARHDMWAAAQQLGAGEIHLMDVRDIAERERIGKDILEAQTPVLNRQMLRRVA